MIKYMNVLFACERGGTRKSTATAFYLAAACLAEEAVLGFEIDRQTRLIEMYPDLVQPIMLPDDEKLLEDDQAITRCFSPLYSAMVDPNGPAIVADVGANIDSTLSGSMLRNRLAMRLEASGRETAICIMLDADPETILAAARTTAAFQVSLPEAHLIFVMPDLELKFGDARSPHHAEALEAFNRVIKPALKKGDRFNFPNMRPSTRRAFVEQGVSPIDFLELDPEVLGGGDEWVGNDILWSFGDFMNHFRREAERTLKFRDSD